MPKKIRLTIGEFSKFCRVTIKTLRHYDKMGLLAPKEVDEWTHYRYYHVSQMQQLNAILRLKNLGFSLEEIRELLDEGTHTPTIPQIEEKKKATEQQIEALKAKRAELQRLGDSIMHISNMERISIQRLPAIIVASHRRMLKRREDLIPLFNNVINPEIQRIGCVRTLPIYGFAMEHEPEYKTEDIDTEYCLQVEAMYDDTDIIKFKQLPEVPKAVCLKHTGTYDTINESFAEVMHYIETNGYKIAGLYRIQFEEGQHNQKDPEKFVTIIQVPVTKNVLQTPPPNETNYQ